MDRARAIRLAAKWSQGHVCTLREGEAQEYHKLCLAALQEQEQREQGCEYCRNFTNGHGKTVTQPNGKFIRYTKFCDECGRKLGGADNA